MLHSLARVAQRLLEVAAVLLLLAMLASVFLGVVFRLADDPLTWSDEMATYLLVWTGFVGWIIAGQRGSHIRITAIIAKLRGTALMLAEIVIQLLVLAFGLILLTQSFGLIQRNLDVEWVSLPLSVALVYIPIPIAGFAVVLQAGLEILRLVRERPAP